MKKLAYYTLGCKVNQYETEAIANEFLKHNFIVVNFSEGADIYLINTCTVTNRADYKSRYIIKKVINYKRINPAIKIIVTGCYTQKDYNLLKEWPEIDYFFHNNEKSHIVSYVLQNNKKIPQKFPLPLSFTRFDELSTDYFTKHTRAFVKIQDGCNYNCAYCIVPLVRGPCRSRCPHNIITQVKRLSENGYKEIVLTGINLGSYRYKLHNYYLLDLIRDISGIESVEQIRISSIEHKFVTDEFIYFLRDNDKICHHFHIPLQTGSNELLKSMRRNYSKEQFKWTIDKIKSAMPDSALGFDVIVGLPGETDKLFAESINFISQIQPAYLHIFPYSQRKGTSAYNLKNQINGKIKSKRIQKLKALNSKFVECFKQEVISKKIILRSILEERRNGYWTGVSDHYLRIYYKSKKAKKGQLLKFISIEKFKDGILVRRSDSN